MPKKQPIDVQVLRDLLKYDPNTGKLYWRERPLKYCHDEPHQVSFNKRKAGKQAFTANHNAGYHHGSVLGVSLLAHRVCWAMHSGAWPDQMIDHINGDRKDNRISNLRTVNATESSRNLGIRSDNTSGTVGIYWARKVGKWRARIFVDKKPIHIGYFESKDDAIAARKAAEVEYNFHPNHGRK